jgi:hypothetical protein
MTAQPLHSSKREIKHSAHLQQVLQPPPTMIYFNFLLDFSRTRRHTQWHSFILDLGGSKWRNKFVARSS